MTTADWQTRMEATVSKHEVALYGDNARPGISARMTAVEEKIRTEKNNTLWLIGILIAILGDIAAQLLT